ncbi:MAG: DNA polymerase III subunit delta' [candidate division NC10 bacterium]|nr:DNA polymerase III subunit delta' [candidate division NC10 bacterium]
MSFREILGHKRPIAILQRAIQSGHLSHAYLFAGPEGIGKRQVALNLAKALNCEGGAAGDCCDACIPCRKIDKGIHPDVSLIEPQASSPKTAPSLKIEQARDVQKEISLKPYEGRKKVYIFDDAEKMTDEAENALLKTLEEPTGETLLILVTSSPHSLLPTVLSRTQRIRFDPLGPEEVGSYLMKTRSWEAERAKFVASLSGGSLGRALAREEKELFSLRDQTLAGLSTVLQGGICEILDLAESWAKEKEDLPERLEYLLIWVRDLKVYQTTGEETLLVNRDLGPRIREEAALHLPAALSHLFQIIQETSFGLSRHANPRLSLEVMFTRMRAVFHREEEIAYAQCGEDQV